MGREVKRVALDFDCKVGETWGPRINPHRVASCTACDGSGSHESAQALEHLARLILLAGDVSKTGRPLHPYFNSTPLRRVGTRLHEVSSGLAGREGGAFGHDSIDAWNASAAILKAAGLSEDWGQCAECGGSGEAPGQEEVKRLSEEWVRPEPPEGPGWQLWQTVSEGGPVSPVFKAPEDLARWLVRNDDSVTRGRSYEQWMAFLTGPGWAPSMMAAPEAGLTSGVEAVATREIERLSEN